MKQTAVEWLRKELLKRDMDISIKDLFEQAKEMEREQIIGTFNEGALDGLQLGEQYYNETFKK
jgi:hypothetical protein